MENVLRTIGNVLKTIFKSIGFILGTVLSKTSEPVGKGMAVTGEFLVKKCKTEKKKGI